MTEPAIEVHSLSKIFGHNKALDSIDLSIKSGITTGLVGPNGAGKTTLFSLLCDFIKPTSGHVTVLGNLANAPALRNRISILPQDASMLKSVPIGKQLTMLAELQGFSSAEAKKEALRVLTLVGLEQNRNQSKESLSHGMAKRVAISQAFIGSPEIIILDEPTAGLDPNTTDTIKSAIRKLNGQATIIISSHNLEVIEDLCEEIIILQKGKLHSHEKVSELTARTKALTFKLEQDPSKSLQEKLATLPMVTKVTAGKPGQHRVVVYFNDDSNNPAELQIIKLLAESGVLYREMIRGERLQDTVTDRLT